MDGRSLHRPASSNIYRTCTNGPVVNYGTCAGAGHGHGLVVFGSPHVITATVPMIDWSYTRLIILFGHARWRFRGYFTFRARHRGLLPTKMLRYAQNVPLHLLFTSIERLNVCATLLLLHPHTTTHNGWLHLFALYTKTHTHT